MTTTKPTKVELLAGKLRGQPAFEAAVDAEIEMENARAAARRCARKLNSHPRLSEEERELLHNAVGIEAGERRQRQQRRRRAPAITVVEPLAVTFPVGSRVRVHEWRPADNDQSMAPCLGTVAVVEDDRIYVQPDGQDGHWLALRVEALTPNAMPKCLACSDVGVIRDVIRNTYEPCVCTKPEVAR